MSVPLPLIQTPAADLDWSQPDTPAATAFGDIYFSTDGGLDETRAVFLGGCGLPQGWVDRSVFTIAELGFGSGLNFLATWKMWAETAQPQQRLHYVSIEKFPFDRTQLKRALTAWPELEHYSKHLLDNWPGRVKGIHRLDFGPVTLTLIHDDVVEALDQVDGLQADAWFLDGFSPSGNPAMWSPEVMTRLARSTAPGARLATFSVAGAVRTALKEAGFSVRKMPGFGRKRHRLEADFPGEQADQKRVIHKALIVGAGIAGRSLARALYSRNIDFDIIDDRSHPAASSNPVALVKPRFDLQDRPESRFFLAAYLHALRSFPEESILSRGVKQIPKNEKEADRFKKITQQAPLGNAHVKWENDALWIDSALVVDPSRIFQDMTVQHGSYETAKNNAEYSHVFFAAGYGIRTLAPSLQSRFSRGQLSWAKPIWDMPTAYGGYAINLGDEALIGATHDRLDERDPFELRQEDDLKNLSNLAHISGKDVEAVDRTSRASVRVTSKDTLPILADLGNSHWALSGLGSRGFTFAPLLAETLVAHICGEIGPSDKHVRTKFSSLDRFN